MDKDGTFTSTGAQGGTELMLAELRQRVKPELLDQFNLICSRVRHIDPQKKNILWLHDLWNDPEASHLRDARSLGRFTKLVFVSHYQQYSYFAGLGVPYSAGVVMQNAIEPIPFHAKPATDDGRINLIYHTTPHRGLELLVPVFIELTREFPNIHLDVFSSFNAYGWPDRDKPYQELFDICREHPQITYHGFQPNSVVREALQRAHIFAYPSIWVETSCIAAIEALSAGCEIVCPTLGALPETTANFARLYPWHENPNVHANLFLNLLANVIERYKPNTPKQDIQRNYASIVYSWKHRAEQWNGLFSYLLESSKSS
jgi:glycosyltransferase involved in cell wall biosynthesis